MHSEEVYKKVLKNLESSLALPVLKPRDCSGIIRDFEMTYELSWKVLKEKLLSEGHQTLGAKSVYTKAYQLGYISKEELWIQIIEDRLKASVYYDEGEAKKIVENIQLNYISLFKELLALIEKK